MILDINSLLSSDNINQSIIALDNYICELCNYGEELGKLNEAQRNFFFNQNLEREVNNGGFSQYFLNSSGNYAHETVLSLKGIGADKTAALLQKAINLFPDQKVPVDSTIRNEVVAKVGEQATEEWNVLDQEFYEYADNLNALNMEYIRKNKDKF